MQRRCDRNRKRSKRRGIYCPIHGCYLDSVSRKHLLLASNSLQLQPAVGNRLNTLTLHTMTPVLLESEWLEAFWCEECQTVKWYHIKQNQPSDTSGNQALTYEVSVPAKELWQQTVRVINFNMYSERSLVKNKICKSQEAKQRIKDIQVCI